MFLLVQVMNMSLTCFNQSGPPLLNVFCMCEMLILMCTVTKLSLYKEEHVITVTGSLDKSEKIHV